MMTRDGSASAPVVTTRRDERASLDRGRRRTDGPAERRLSGVLGGTFLSRADVADWPLVGPVARAIDAVFLDRTASWLVSRRGDPAGRPYEAAAIGAPS